LLHEGSGSTAVNAFVELVFDNSDGRFAMENSDEVVLRRTIGHKKDEFFLQRKRCNKQEVMSLLEGAGFSKSNPYFIVQQGKVNALCCMSDAERLMLLKEVAGTTVYDEKKQESLLKMEENKTSIWKINESLEYMEERLEELRDEKEELTQYQTLDRQRRAMEYTLYDKELGRAREQLNSIEHERVEEMESMSQLHEQARTTHDSIRSFEALQKRKTHQLRRNRVALQQLESDKTSITTTKTKLELECKELEETLRTNEEVLRSNEKELAVLNRDIEEAQEQLISTVQPNYDTATEELSRMQHELAEAKKQMDGLYAKQGRGRQFDTKQQRDTYLQEKVDELESAKTEKEASLQQQQESLSNLRRSAQTDAKAVDEKKADVSSKLAALQSLTKTIDDKKRQRVELHDVRKDQWRRSEELLEQVKESRENAQRAQSDLRKVMPRATSLGLEALQNIVEHERLVVGEEYFGMVMENMDLVDPKFQAAVEVAAQNSLFHVIVDTDATAARLMRRLERDKLGRVTFLPLNRLRIEEVEYPESPDVRPLLQTCIRYDKKVERAMQHVFGKKLLARNKDAASTWRAKCKMDAITLEGDLCDRRGALTGGYVDSNKSRLRAHKQHVEAQETLTKAEAEHRSVNRKAQSTDQAVTNLMGELQRLEAKQADFNHILSEIESDIDRLEKRVESQQKNTEKIEKTVIPPLEKEISSLGGEIERLQEEMGTELTATLSEEDRETLNRLKKSQVELAARIESQNELVEKVSVERQKLQSLLEDNLLKRRQELTDQSDSSSRRRSRGGAPPQQQQREDLEQRQRELDDANRIADDIENRLSEARKVDDELKAELISAKGELDQLKNEDMKNTSELEKAQEQAERLLNKVIL
jgi:structural maintenance of chromosome 3 (chondroitin sulfate proteoglycan 6)